MPSPAAPFRRALDGRLDKLKNRLLGQFLQSTGRPEFNVLFRHAANEAAALAWVTPFQLLVLPDLLEENPGRAAAIAAAGANPETRPRTPGGH